ncbi:MAG: 5-oxoprolinase subunit PxpB [Chloroflexi bacterium]|nr:5-oxoprolinase subunit PxpB [Chloroflexota bacterium]
MSDAPPPVIRPFGERALLVEVGDRVGVEEAVRALAVADAWEQAGHGIAIPAYASAVLRFDPLRLAPADAERLAAAIVAEVASRSPRPSSGRVVEIRTRYDGADLADVAAASGLTTEELVALHSGRDYVVYFLGFSPGFAYCGPIDGRIHAPRLPRPRERVPRGSVAVADGQTTVYPLASPGGWQLLGTTDLAMFDPANDPPALLRPGDRVRFVPS